MNLVFRIVKVNWTWTKSYINLVFCFVKVKDLLILIIAPILDNSARSPGQEADDEIFWQADCKINPIFMDIYQ